jgi:hypothetical protein
MRIHAEQKLVNRAIACIQRDKSTLMSEEAIKQQAALDGICDRVWADILPEPSENDIVFFDPETKAFWLYPR